MNELVVFDPVKAELAEYKKQNLELVFDYEDPQGNKDARSHIYKLRQAKTKIADVHKVAKAEALGVCRLLDGEKNKLTDEVEEMINVHYKPVKEIEERVAKAAAVKANEERLEAIRVEAERAAERERREQELAAKETALEEKEAALVREQEKLEAAKQAEVDKAAAVKDAQEAAERDRLAAIAKAEQDKKDAAEQAEQEKQAAVETEKERQRKEADAIQVELDKQREIDAERIADEKHRASVESEIRVCLFRITDDDAMAGVILTALVNDEIAFVTIKY
ncbi:hypothetical protein LCGC14_2404830 [marine sediment metagenome]|uniref:Uncharacterized protein n=1 Tax=marine sediment metagenome TaxID=412755 RepID=A0A0F9BUC9_9ZZZZ